jgi:hypothetical protein
VSLQGRLNSRLGTSPYLRQFGRRLPTVAGAAAASWVRSKVKSCRIRGGQSGIGTSFLRVLRFPIPIIIIIRVGYNMPNSDKGSKWNQSDPTPRKSHVLF